MLAKCASQSCSRTFRYLREGKLFRIETDAGGPASGKVSGHTGEWYWLCGECAAKFTVKRQPGTSAVAVPRSSHARSVML
jgi:hypothetical protein